MSWWPALLGAGVGIPLGVLAERLTLAPGPTFEQPEGPRFGTLVGTRSTSVTPAGQQLAVEAFGPPDAPRVVLTHGWTNSRVVWHEQVVRLADRHRVVTWDLPGHGDSPPPRDGRYTLDRLGDACASVLTDLGPGRCVLAGHSLGGMTVLNVTRRHGDVVAGRVAGLALVSTMGHAPLQVDALTRMLSTLERLVRRLLVYGGLAAFERAYWASTDLSHALTRAVALSRSAAAHHVDAAEQLLLDADPDMIAGMTLPILTLAEDDAVGDLDLPGIVLCGDADRMTPLRRSRELAAALSGARLEVLEGVGHMAPLEAAPAVCAALEELAAGI